MIRTLLTDAVRTAAEAVVAAAGQSWPDGLVIRLEQPARTEFGEYASNVAMQLVKHLRRNPLQIAQEVRERLGDLPYVAKAEVAPPGFLNFRLDWGWWAANGARLAAEQGARNRAERQGTKVVVEHTSVNPNKSMHVGHLRNSCLGDTVARLQARVGYPVEIHNYIDDTGVQVADTVVGLLHLQHHGDYRRFGDFCWDLYARVTQTYTTDESLKAKRAEVLHAIEEGSNTTAWTAKLVAERLVREHLAEVLQFGIEYDVLVWESEIVGQGFWAAAFELLKRSPLFVKETEGRFAGCWVLKRPSDGGAEVAEDEEYNPDKILVKSNGTLTYTAKDIAYHLWKFGLLGRDFKYQPFPGFKGCWTSTREGATKPFGRAARVYNVIDKRQEYPQAMVKLALDTLGFSEAAAGLHHIGYGVVSLSPATAAALGLDTSDGRPFYAMSGRQGIGIKVTDLLDTMAERIEQERTRKVGVSSRAIAAGAVRYYLLRHAVKTDIVFDMDQALDIKGNTGPYLMYAHARAAAMLRKAGLPSEAPAGPGPQPPAQLHPAEQALLRHLADWPDTLEEAARDINITLLTSYAYDLATLFHHFYEAAPVLKAAEPERTWRLWLVSAFRATLADALHVLGLPAPQRM